MSCPIPDPDRRHDLEECAKRLEESGAYRVLRRLVPSFDADPGDDARDGRLALYLDVETTGLDPARDEIIEIAVCPFRYAPSGEVIAIHEPISQLRQPSRPIPAGIVALTGIDDAAVAGRMIDDASLAPLLARRPLVVAHNAAFDRSFVEALLPAFAGLPWACSMREVPWRDEGMTALNLPVLAADAGFFYDAHRAADDCVAAVELLRRPLPRSGRTAFAALLDSARRASYRVMAVGAPYAARGLLKARGYRWSDGADGRPRCWSATVEVDALQPERAWLRGTVYRAEVEVPAVRLTAWTRYSSRA